MNNSRYGIIPPDFKGSTNRHKHGLCIRPLLALVMKRILSYYHRWPDFSLGLVVFGQYIIVIKKSKRIFFMAFQPLSNPGTVFVKEFSSNKLVEFQVKALFESPFLFLRDIFFLSKAKCVSLSLHQFLTKCQPFLRCVLLCDCSNLTEEVDEARLAIPGDLVKVLPEIRHQDSFKNFTKELLKRRRPSRLIYHKAGQSVIGKASKPIRHTIDSPYCLIRVKIGTILSFLRNLIISDRNDYTQVLPNLNQVIIVQCELKMKVQHFKNMIDGNFESIVKPNGQSQKIEPYIRVGKSSCHSWLYYLVDTLSKIPMYYILGDDRLRKLNVFNISLSGCLCISNFINTVRTAGEWKFLFLVYQNWLLSIFAFLALLAYRLLSDSATTVFFLTNRHCPRGTGEVFRLIGLIWKNLKNISFFSVLFENFSEFQHLEDYSFWALLVYPMALT